MKTNRQSIRATRIISCIFILTLLVWSHPLQALANPSAAIPDKAQPPSKLEKQVQEWATLLAKQKPFAVWQSIDPQIEALGPGTHSWLVLFTKEGKDIGYMVVHAVTDGSYKLGEYGLGPYSLFSQQLLRKALIDNGLITVQDIHLMTAVKHYIHPLAAAWEVKIKEDSYWFDAKTAELLPIDALIWNKIAADYSDPVKENLNENIYIDSFLLNESFDAYERLPWLTKEAPFPANNTKKLQKRLKNKQHLRYVTEPFGDNMLYAIPVIGYQFWLDGRMDLALEMEGTRFIPKEALLHNGLFYR